MNKCAPDVATSKAKPKARRNKKRAPLHHRTEVVFLQGMLNGEGANKVSVDDQLIACIFKCHGHEYNSLRQIACDRRMDAYHQ